MPDRKPTPTERSAALTWALKRWKDAHSLRYEDQCPSRRCRKWTQWSVQLEGDEAPEQRRKGQDGVEYEPCAYFCTTCGWSNGGSRPVENDEVDDE